MLSAQPDSSPVVSFCNEDPALPAPVDAEDVCTHKPDTRPFHEEQDPAFVALEEGYWNIVRTFEHHGYQGKVVEPHGPDWPGVAIRVPDDGRYPHDEVLNWSAHLFDFHGSAEAIVTIDGGGNPVVRQIEPNFWPEYFAISTDTLAEQNSQILETARKLAALALNPPPIPDHTAAPDVDPFVPHRAGGLLEAIARWVSLTNRRPAPEFAMLAAIAFVSALYGRRVVGPTNAGANIYLAGIASTGFGKEHPLAALQTLAHAAGFSYLIGPGDVTSGAAIEKIVRRRPSFIMPMDEIGALLQSINGRGAATWAKTIRKSLLELFSKSTGIWTGKEYADPTQDSSAEPIFAPTVSFMGMSTPETFYGGLTEESLSDGFLNRLVVVSTSKRPKAQEAAPLSAPASLIQMVKDYAAALPQSTLAAKGARDGAKQPAMVAVPWESDCVKNFWNAIEEWQHVQVSDHGRLGGVLGRFALQVVKLATIRALSRDPAAPVVRIDDVEWGRAIVWRSVAYIEQGIEQHMAGSAFEELVNATLNALQAAPGGRMSMSHLVRKKGVSKADERTLRLALNRLVERGDIYQPSIEGRGLVVALRRDEDGE